MSQVRFQVLSRPASTSASEAYGWRLIGANNRELGRSAVGFVSYREAQLAVMRLRQGVGRAVQHSATDPATGRWSWRLAVDGYPVAVSGRWYERDQDARLGAAKFVSLAGEAALVDGVLTLRDVRGLGAVATRGGGAP